MGTWHSWQTKSPLLVVYKPLTSGHFGFCSITTSELWKQALKKISFAISWWVRTSNKSQLSHVRFFFYSDNENRALKVFKKLGKWDKSNHHLYCLISWWILFIADRSFLCIAYPPPLLTVLCLSTKYYLLKIIYGLGKDTISQSQKNSCPIFQCYLVT